MTGLEFLMFGGLAVVAIAIYLGLEKELETEITNDPAR